MKKEEKEQVDPRIEKIGKRIQELRKAKGFTSHETFAYVHELPRVQYWRMEKGTNFTMTSLLQILDIHKISLEEFFKGM